jgi:hypothetical protein
MVTAVKGDRASKELAVYQALDQAFVKRVSRLFDAMCDNTALSRDPRAYKPDSTALSLISWPTAALGRHLLGVIP